MKIFRNCHDYSLYTLRGRRLDRVIENIVLFTELFVLINIQCAYGNKLVDLTS